MKKFDLKAALNGEPVMLRNGKKAFVVYDLRNYQTLMGKLGKKPLNGIVLNEDGDKCKYIDVEWNEAGSNASVQFDIIRMWQDPKPTSEQVLEKAYNEDLLVLCDGNPDLPLKVIAKTKNGEFVMQPEDDNIQPWLANLTMEWFFVKNLDPKFDTSTNTIALPKPFKPKDGETFYYAYCGKTYCDHEYSERSPVYRSFSQNGQCFRTEEDAQKWLDFMKSMME